MSTSHLRPALARDGIFNLRDLGGTPAGDGRAVREGMLVRADALQRSSAATARALHEHGIRRVLDLRDDSERAEDGTFCPADGLDIDVVHLPVLDPTYEWEVLDVPRDQVLAHRYADILVNFGDRFADAVTAVAATDGGVAFHCAVGKDRTGLLAMLLLGALGSPREAIVADYVRSARAGAVQVAWLRVLGLRYGDVDDEEIAVGVWSARAATMHATIDRLDAEHGGIDGYLRSVGVGDDVVGALRGRLLRVAT
ncbi:MAG: tyrosine-protein phosphatase [Actinobacteria bacterium]|nr:tyrosine-protein phosphatase [Actinomycetota bacterium]